MTNEIQFIEGEDFQIPDGFYCIRDMDGTLVDTDYAKLSGIHRRLLM